MALSNGPNLGVLVDGGIGETHYNALMAQWRAFDALIQAKVVSSSIATPPGSPVDGACYVVPSGATGVWSSHIGKIARYSTKQTAWEYFTPKKGWVVHNDATDVFLKYTGSAWAVYGLTGYSSLQNFADDAAAAVGGIVVGGLYRTGSAVMVRVS